MVLDDDINGFRGNPKRKGGGKKNKKVRKSLFRMCSRNLFHLE